MLDDLTKISHSLIIIQVRVLNRYSGSGVSKDSLPHAVRRFPMKVSVYALEDGRMDVLVQATPGKGRAPVVVQDVTPEDVVTRVGKVVTEMRRPKVLERELS